MITIQQWCAVIGSFTQRSSSSYMHDGSVLEYDDDDDDDDAYVEYMHYESVVQYGDTYTAYIYNCVMVLVNMGAFVTLSFIMVTYLLSCGDIESNPGPGLYIVCPSYRGQVHVQRSVCFIFKKKTRYGGYKKCPVDFATTTDQHSVASASKTKDSGEESEKCSADTTVLSSDSENILCVIPKIV